MGNYSVMMQFDIEAGVDAVVQALATSEGIASWWSTQVDGDVSGNGSKFGVGFPDVDRPFEFEVAEFGRAGTSWLVGSYPPPWAGTSIRWEVGANPDGSGTRLVFSHNGFEPDDPVIPIITPTWAQVILRLKRYAESGEPQPFFDF